MWKQSTPARLGLAAVAAATLALGDAAAAQQTIEVTPGNLQGWEANVSFPWLGSSAISGEQPYLGDGSLKLRAGALYTESSFELSYGCFLVTCDALGRLDRLTDLSFDWFRSSLSTVAPQYTPSFSLLVGSPTLGDLVYLPSELIWQGALNGYSAHNPAPTDRWVHVDLMDQVFARESLFGGGQKPLSAWQSLFDPDAMVYGIAVGVEAGALSSFEGYADNITLGFDGQTTTWVFNLTETPQSVVPEPMSMALLGTGLAGLAAARRRRRRGEEVDSV